MRCRDPLLTAGERACDLQNPVRVRRDAIDVPVVAHLRKDLGASSVGHPEKVDVGGPKSGERVARKFVPLLSKITVMLCATDSGRGNSSDVSTSPGILASVGTSAVGGPAGSCRPYRHWQADGLMAGGVRAGPRRTYRRWLARAPYLRWLRWTRGRPRGLTLGAFAASEGVGSVASADGGGGGTLEATPVIPTLP